MTEEEYLKNYDISQYPRPSLATDIVLFSLERDRIGADIKAVNVQSFQILLIRRASHPFMNKWALPGGFCRNSESVYETAKRELYEETNISNAYLELAGIYSNLNRDPRGWIISTAWLGLIDRYQCNLRADTDAWEAAWFSVAKLTSEISMSSMNSTEYTHKLTLINNETGESLYSEVTETIILNKDVKESIYATVTNDFAFDHNEIITKTLVNFRETIKEDIRPIFNLVPTEFTLGELQAAYELILDCQSRNFRRRIEDYVIETPKYDTTKGFRPAKLYVRNPEKFKTNT